MKYTFKLNLVGVRYQLFKLNVELMQRVYKELLKFRSKGNLIQVYYTSSRFISCEHGLCRFTTAVRQISRSVEFQMLPRNHGSSVTLPIVPQMDIFTNGQILESTAEYQLVTMCISFTRECIHPRVPRFMWRAT